MGSIFAIFRIHKLWKFLDRLSSSNGGGAYTFATDTAAFWVSGRQQLLGGSGPGRGAEGTMTLGWAA